ncbi:MAG TPA: RNA methyltransferase [Candidatus Woesearchaeota archaeon]|nr:RNA methyltransferase [Candidatus Woesearchaeota archaeon]
MIYIVLVEPETPGNIGAVARVMSNFGFRKLVLINPKCSHESDEAWARAKHGRSILDKCIVEDFGFLSKLDTRIATSAKVGGKNNVFRAPVEPREVSKAIKKHNRGKIGIIFGRESSGLTNEEIESCDFIVTIPSEKNNKTLNISHSAAIMLYELFYEMKKEQSSQLSHFEHATGLDKEWLARLFDEVCGKLEFETGENKEALRIVFKRVIGKAFLTKKEFSAMMGLLRKINRKLS